MFKNPIYCLKFKRWFQKRPKSRNYDRNLGRSWNHRFSSCPLVFETGDQCTTSVFGDKPCRILKVLQCFGMHYSFHLQNECIWSRGKKSYLQIRQLAAMGYEWRDEDRAAIQSATSKWLRKRGNKYVFRYHVVRQRGYNEIKSSGEISPWQWRHKQSTKSHGCTTYQREYSRRIPREFIRLYSFLWLKW